MKVYEHVEYVPHKVKYYECDNCGHHSKTNSITHCDYCGKEICSKCMKTISNEKFDKQQLRVFENVMCYHVCSDCANIEADKIYEKLVQDKNSNMEKLEKQLEEYIPKETVGISGSLERTKALMAKLKGE